MILLPDRTYGSAHLSNALRLQCTCDLLAALQCSAQRILRGARKGIEAGHRISEVFAELRQPHSCQELPEGYLLQLAIPATQAHCMSLCQCVLAMTGHQCIWTLHHGQLRRRVF